MSGVFVVGAPRSGANIVGDYLGSGRNAVNLGPCGAFDLAYRVAPGRLGEIPGPFRDEYLSSLKVHARAFAAERANELGRAWYCESTAWNVLVADALAEDLPDALFVLTVRHYSGAIQSARRAEGTARLEVGSWEQSAERWAASYAAAERLPAERTVMVSYEAIAEDPDPEAKRLSDALEGLGFDTAGLDAHQLLPHAPAQAGAGEKEAPSSVAGFDPRHWSGDLQTMVWPVVHQVHRELQRRFGSAYRLPPKPEGLKIHDETLGLVPFEVVEW